MSLDALKLNSISVVFWFQSKVHFYINHHWSVTWIETLKPSRLLSVSYELWEICESNLIFNHINFVFLRNETNKQRKAHAIDLKEDSKPSRAFPSLFLGSNETFSNLALITLGFFAELQSQLTALPQERCSTFSKPNIQQYKTGI